MSDTDDTDNLLLIPPDFFVINSDTEDSTKAYGPYYKVVDSLITQVNKLENRLTSIESASDSSFVSSLDTLVNNYNNKTNLMSGIRKCNSLENIPPQSIDVYFSSTHSTPQKPRYRFKQNSLPSTPSTDRYTPRRPRITNAHVQDNRSYLRRPHNDQQKPRNDMLNEIDTFISNVKTIQKYQSARNLNAQFDMYGLQEKAGLDANKFDNSAITSKTGMNVGDVDQMLHAMEAQQREIESRLKETVHELGVSRRTAESKEHLNKRKVLWKHGDNKISVPDYGMGMRDVLYADMPREPQEHHQEHVWKQGSNKSSVPDRGMGMRDILYREPTRIEEHPYKEKLWKQGENKSSVPDHGMGMRDILYTEPTRIEEHPYKEKLWKQGENKSSVPDRGMGVRDLLYNAQPINADESLCEAKLWKQSESKPSILKHDNLLSEQSKSNGYKVQPHENNRTTLTTTAGEQSTTDSAHNTESVYTDNSPSPSSSDSTQLTAYQNRNKVAATRDTTNASYNPEKIHSSAMQVLNKHKNLLLRNRVTSPTNERDSQRQNNAPNSPKESVYSYQSDLYENKSSEYEPSTKNALALLSLSELWNHNSAATGDLRYHDRSKFLNKLQEEKLRRQHCEQLIQQLQTRTLELQERLAVAVQVDQAKDSAILRIHKSWEEAAAKIDSLNNKSALVEQQISQLRNNSAQELSEAAKKVSHYENEASKALNLAHSSQERLAVVEKHNAFLTSELEAFEGRLKMAEDNYNTEANKAQQLSNLLSQKEIELNENKNILSDARKEVAQSKRAVEICQAELTSMRSTQTQLEVQFNEELIRVKELEKEKKKILVDMERHKKIEKTLQDDLDKQKETNDKNKTELRNFYQDQVEIVVKEKLHEFQSQLEKAENSLQDEIRKRELAVAKAAAIHIQQLTERHSLEIHLLEEKHKEEVKLHKLHLSQAQQQIENLHIKFQQQQDRRSAIAQQLHKVMEVQWLEVLKIINSSKSPIVSQDKSTNTIDQLNFIKSKSYNNVEEILFKDEQGDKASGDFKIRKSNMPFFQSFDSMSSTIDDDSQGREQAMETPLTSKQHKSRQQIDNELQKYVQMLLNKSPGNPTDEQNSKYDKPKTSPDNHIDSRSTNYHQNSQTEKLNPDASKSSKAGLRDRLGKPPWK